MVSGHLRDAARLRLAVTLVFGLIHGFGFAANLLEMWLLKERLFELLLGFNLGVEIGQLSLILTVLGIVYLLVRAGPVLVCGKKLCLVGVCLINWPQDRNGRSPPYCSIVHHFSHCIAAIACELAPMPS